AADGLKAAGHQAVIGATGFASLASALGGMGSFTGAALDQDATFRDLTGRYDDATTKLDALRAGQDSAAAAGGRLKGSIEDQVSGLRAFDDATFGISQQLAGVNLQIDEKKLERLQRIPATTPQREKLVLEQELKVRGDERDVQFGGRLHELQEDQGQFGAATARAALAIKDQEHAVADLKHALDDYRPVLADV